MSKKESAQRPRELAIRVLGKVLGEGQALDEVLQDLASTGLSPESRAWLQDVCSGTLRWKGRLDQAIDSAALKKKPSGWLRRALLVAAFQLIGQERVPAALVVSETVDEIRKKEGEAPARFANAVLRRISEHAGEWKALPFPPDSQRSKAAAGVQASWASMPEWLWLRLVNSYGLEWARSFAQACLDRPQIWVRARTSDWKPAWAEAGPVPNAWKVMEGGAITQKEGFVEGEFIVQDLSSQFLIHEVLGKIPAPNPGQALDLCAAPGGKAVGLSWSGFQVSASDRSPDRMKLLRSTLERVASEVRVLEPDEATAAGSLYDLVWVDAPCTGTGIIRRHPDVRWLRKPEHLKSLTALQKELLKKGWEKVRPGGHLVYSVCSVLPEEGANLARSSELPGSVEVQDWLLAPHLTELSSFGSDGFWCRLFRKSG